MSGLFVTFEGGEGSGKSTQIVRLESRLRDAGIATLVTREPGGTPLGERLRALLLDAASARDAPRADGAEPGLAPGALTEALLMEAARAELVATVLEPALAAGTVVLCDRYADSTLAYQGAGRGLDAAMLASWNRAATGGLTPDLTLLIDLPVRLGLSRRAGAAGPENRIDRESEAFHTRVRERYLELARAEPARIVVLDGSLAPEPLAARVWEAVSARLPAAQARPAG